MQCDTVERDTSSPSPTLRFSPRFNVAVPFIDRHMLDQLRGRAAEDGDRKDPALSAPTILAKFTSNRLTNKATF